jgi:UDP-GlcNAc:undecaprenyl-phosphate GlcNAc-1-phosphate transferase
LLDEETTAKFIHGEHRRGIELIAIFVGAIGMLLVGLWDDKHESRPAGKFICQFAVAALVAASGARITLFVPSTLFSFAVTILWILTVINAFNFMDNMNGLCGGLGAIGSFYFGLTAATAAVPQYLVALIAFLTCGALVGFLPYNFPRAKSFLGDSGSHLVGYLLAVLAILPHFYTSKSAHTLAVLTPLLILAVPLGDLVWVVILRTRMGKPFYIGDNNHLSHRLVRLGLNRTRAVLVIWLIALAVGALAFV